MFPRRKQKAEVKPLAPDPDHLPTRRVEEEVVWVGEACQHTIKGRMQRDYVPQRNSEGGGGEVQQPIWQGLSDMVDISEIRCLWDTRKTLGAESVVLLRPCIHVMCKGVCP